VTRGKVRVVVSCEHGGNRIPAAYRRLFRGERELLASHRAYDPGALELARSLARRLRAPLHDSQVSRLLVELNRSPGHRRLFSAWTRELPPRERERILARYYFPHRLSIERRIAASLARGTPVVHVASHSFTPVLGGRERDADVAWLFDPSRAGERDLARRWRSDLASRRPDLRLRFNYPYRGTSDGLTTHLRARFPRGYLGIELEVSQRFHFADRSARARLRRDVVESLAHLLDAIGSKR
jgi:predicted N-formylglutamate amidohydrolase